MIETGLASSEKVDEDCTFLIDAPFARPLFLRAQIGTRSACLPQVRIERDFSEGT
jgi:hypothetical protein